MQVTMMNPVNNGPKSQVTPKSYSMGPTILILPSPCPSYATPLASWNEPQLRRQFLTQADKEKLKVSDERQSAAALQNIQEQSLVAILQILQCSYGISRRMNHKLGNAHDPALE